MPEPLGLTHLESCICSMDRKDASPSNYRVSLPVRVPARHSA